MSDDFTITRDKHGNSGVLCEPGKEPGFTCVRCHTIHSLPYCTADDTTEVNVGFFRSALHTIPPTKRAEFLDDAVGLFHDLRDRLLETGRAADQPLVDRVHDWLDRAGAPRT